MLEEQCLRRSNYVEGRRLDCRAGCTNTQPTEHRRGNPSWKIRSRFRSIGFRKIQSSLRHSLCRRPAEVRGEPQLVCATISRQMKKPDCDSIEGLSPSISIDQKQGSHNPRSTVSTVTEIMDYLRLLWARIGIPHCPECGVEVARRTVQEIVDDIIWHYEGHGIFVWSPVIRRSKRNSCRPILFLGRARVSPWPHQWP